MDSILQIIFTLSLVVILSLSLTYERLLRAQERNRAAMKVLEALQAHIHEREQEAGGDVHWSKHEEEVFSRMYKVIKKLEEDRDKATPKLLNYFIKRVEGKLK